MHRERNALWSKNSIKFNVETLFTNTTKCLMFYRVYIQGSHSLSFITSFWKLYSCMPALNAVFQRFGNKIAQPILLKNVQ